MGMVCAVQSAVLKTVDLWLHDRIHRVDQCKAALGDIKAEECETFSMVSDIG
jgi:hypothetical protein